MPSDARLRSRRYVEPIAPAATTTRRALSRRGREPVRVGPVALLLRPVHDELDLEAATVRAAPSAVTSERTEITAPAWAAADR